MENSSFYEFHYRALPEDKKSVIVSANERKDGVTTQYPSPCCMDRRCGRTEPYPCSGLCDADVLRAPQLQHSVQYVDRDGHLARLSPVRLRTQPVTDDALPARDIGLHQSAPTVSRRPL